MADFMSYNAGDLGFVIGGCDSAAVNIDEAARKRKSIDGFVVDDLELINVYRIVIRRVRGERLSKGLDIGRRVQVFHDPKLAFRLFRGFPSDLDILLRREKVETRLQFGPVVRAVCSQND